MENEAAGTLSERRFLAALLWLCAAGAVWLLLSPAAFDRRALTRRAELFRAEVRSEWLRNIGLERWREGLETDPSVIEREARKLGYGRPGEMVYPIRPEEPVPSTQGPPDRREMFRTVLEAAAPALMLLIAGAIVVLLLTDLRIEEN